MKRCRRYFKKTADFAVTLKLSVLAEASLLPVMCVCVCVQVGDFAILLRAGFDRWSAARMQLTTALVGVLGASTALCCQSPQSTGERRDHGHGSSWKSAFLFDAPMFGIPSKTLDGICFLRF